MAVPQGKQSFRRADQQAEGTAAAAGGGADGLVPPHAAIHGLLQGKGDQFRIGGGGEFIRQMLQGPPQLGGVHQVAVVSQGKGPEPGHQHHGLGVADLAAAGGGVAVVPNRQVPRHAIQHLLIEHLADQAHVFMEAHPGALKDSDAGRLLPPMLQGVEPEVGEVGNGLTRSHHGEDAASFLRFVRTFFARWVPPIRGGLEWLQGARGAKGRGNGHGTGITVADSPSCRIIAPVGGRLAASAVEWPARRPPAAA